MCMAGQKKNRPYAFSCFTCNVLCPMSQCVWLVVHWDATWYHPNIRRYPLVMTIDIDGLPSYKMVVIFHGKLAMS
jgi:hypothetical protein